MGSYLARPLAGEINKLKIKGIQMLKTGIQIQRKSGVFFLCKRTQMKKK